VDLREKIVDARDAAAIAAAGAVVVSGYFDPVIAWHARWLENFKKPGRSMLVVITTPDHPILPARARAELVASLRVVDHVAEFSPELAGLEPVIHLEKEDRELFRDLLELVHSRNGAVAAAENR
jgi:bifunctional ADP-heptose synthase (sugar kinase/adenylyltransferase)